MAKPPVYYENEIETDGETTMHFCLDYFNKRLRVDDYRGKTENVRARSLEIAKHHAFTKIFVKSREEDWLSFLSGGFMLEGIYKEYFNGSDAYCMAAYLDVDRRTSDHWLEEDEILQQVLGLAVKEDRQPVPSGCAVRPAVMNDAEPLAALYGGIFQTYPTPMNDSAYIRKAMREGTLFYVVEQSGSLISAASAEINTVYRNAEMTDCATLPAYRSQGLMRHLIHRLEEELERRNIHCAYSLSRALSFGMNASLFQLGYRYYGRLTKNCDIWDKFEDMNLWVKILGRSRR